MSVNQIDYELSGSNCLKRVIKDFEDNERQFSSYGLIFMDCNMPHMDGFETTERLREYFYFECGLPLED